MAFLEIPLTSDFPKYEFRITLNQTMFNIRIRFNQRASYWVMNVSDNNGNPLIMGIPLLLGSLLTSRFVLSGVPLGDLFMLKTVDDYVEPTDQNLGIDSLLIYREA